jgi:hypothetical protein
VMVWDVNPTSWRARACAVAGRALTRAEWDEFLPGRPTKMSALLDLVLTGRRANRHQRIDRPLLPDRPPSGRLVSGTGGQAGVGGHDSVWTISGLDGVSGRPSHAGHQRGRVLLPQPPRTWQLYAARRRTNPGPLLPQAPAVSVSMVGVGWHGRRWLVREQGGSAADPAGHSRCGRPEWRPGSGHRDRTAGSSGRPAGPVARGTARQVGGRWWDAASADGHE